jgi:hypothetical protein
MAASVPRDREREQQFEDREPRRSGPGPRTIGRTSEPALVRAIRDGQVRLQLQERLLADSFTFIRSSGS